MPDVTVEIGGRKFTVACKPGEEESLMLAAEMYANEARRLEEAIGRVPESRMLLMAGLMLADRTKEMEVALRLCETRLKTLEDRLLESESRLAGLRAPRQEDPAGEDLFPNSKEVTGRLAESVARLEAMLDTPEN